jgi:hypothetical protein
VAIGGNDVIAEGVAAEVSGGGAGVIQEEDTVFVAVVNTSRTTRIWPVITWVSDVDVASMPGGVVLDHIASDIARARASIALSTRPIVDMKGDVSLIIK